MFFKSCSLSMRCRAFFLSGSATLFILLFSVSGSYGQRTSGVNTSGTEGNEEIQGRIFFPPGYKSSSRPVIKLQSLSSPELTGVADRDGNFRFTSLRPDQYTIVVDAGDEYERATDTVSIGNSGPVPAQGNPFGLAIPLAYQVQIYLKPKGLNATIGQPATSNTVFADVPLPAQELFKQALENARAGHRLKAIEELKSAISQAPGFALAYNELAVQYLRTGAPGQAVDTLKEGLRVNPEDFTLRLNYGIALLNQKKLDAAESELRVATQNHNADSTAHYYLGLTLMSEQKFDGARPEFEEAIKNGGDKLALAHKYLGGIYWRNKKYREAADELEKYLKLEPNVDEAAKIRDTIKELRHKS